MIIQMNQQNTTTTHGALQGGIITRIQLECCRLAITATDVKGNYWIYVNNSSM